MSHEPKNEFNIIPDIVISDDENGDLANAHNDESNINQEVCVELNYRKKLIEAVIESLKECQIDCTQNLPISNQKRCLV